MHKKALIKFYRETLKTLMNFYTFYLLHNILYFIRSALVLVNLQKQLYQQSNSQFLHLNKGCVVNESVIILTQKTFGRRMAQGSQFILIKLSLRYQNRFVLWGTLSGLFLHSKLYVERCCHYGFTVCFFLDTKLLS